uniref:Uncharacterized protein n=1 Tax=Anguilla anguilla TaxID=7936 RepID=A0A0E9QRA6_ANGAN
MFGKNGFSGDSDYSGVFNCFLDAGIRELS